MAAPTISHDEFAAYTKLIRELTGIVLDSSKTYLVESRLASLLTERHCSTWSELYSQFYGNDAQLLRKQLINRMTTQETSFFRDQAPFELLKFKLLPELIDVKRHKNPSDKRISIRIWSAACSTGQEVYSIIIAAKEILGDLSSYNLQVLGTDISDSAISRASYGTYSRFDIERGMPQERLARYFSQTDNTYKISDEIRSYATFKQLNLHTDFTGLGSWDIIFCRNVAIYFSEDDKRNLFNRFRRNLEPDGSLIIGSTESLLGICHDFEAHRHLRSVYYKKKKG